MFATFHSVDKGPLLQSYLQILSVYERVWQAIGWVNPFAWVAHRSYIQAAKAWVGAHK